MSLKIHQDHSRFKQIVRGKIKANLPRYVQKGEMLGKRGKDTISIPIPFIDIPHFKYGHKEQGGVGQGDGEVGQQAFAVIREAIRKEGMVAIGKVVFTSREHIIALEAR